jgi:cytochrome c553
MSKGWRPLAFGLAVAACFLDAALAQDVAERIRQCGVCHGDDGNSHMPNVPSIAGQPELFLTTQLVLVREGVRTIEGMSPLLKDLKDEDLVAIAKHFAALAAKPSGETIDPALVKRGEELAGALRCASCHLPTLEGQDQMPRLVKQRVDYLIHALTQFRDGTRSGADTLMSNVVTDVSDDDLAALAHYSASR